MTRNQYWSGLADRMEFSERMRFGMFPYHPPTQQCPARIAEQRAAPTEDWHGPDARGVTGL